MRPTKTPAYAIVRIDEHEDAETIDKVSVVKVVTDPAKAIAEIDRLNSLVGHHEYISRYVVFPTRIITNRD